MTKQHEKTVRDLILDRRGEANCSAFAGEAIDAAVYTMQADALEAMQSENAALQKRVADAEMVRDAVVARESRRMGAYMNPTPEMTAAGRSYHDLWISEAALRKRVAELEAAPVWHPASKPPKVEQMRSEIVWLRGMWGIYKAFATADGRWHWCDGGRCHEPIEWTPCVPPKRSES